jgi:hypothetical protein
MIDPVRDATTRCLTCGAQLLDGDHLRWCPDRVHERDEQPRLLSDVEIGALVQKLNNKPTVGALRRRMRRGA